MRSRIAGLLSVVIMTGLVTVTAAAQERSGPDIFTMHSLVSDDASTPAPAKDASLVNGWGLSAGPTTPWWTSNNGTNTSTLYSGAGTKAALTVAVPGGPTGTVFNGSSTDFVVSQSGKSGAARFLFATEAGTILGWSPTVARHVRRRRRRPLVERRGLQGPRGANDRLYATDFHNGRVDVFDASFNLS